MPVLPTGTVTFLFTDIEGSTALWEQHPEAMQIALERHHALLREAIVSQHGAIFNEAGDGLCAAFASAGEALNAGLSAQRALHQTDWGETPIHVRMGLHTGAAEAADSGYRSGRTLNRAARIMSIANGGQILLSQTTADLLRRQLPAGATLRDLGQHRLKGLTENERLLQLVASDLPTEFPALRSASATPNNLPVQLTSFIGRERELAELQRLLPTTRLLTLTGSGGTGKTRLSLQFAAEVLDHFRDGVWFVELAPLTDPDLIRQTVLSALGLREQPGQPLLTTLADYLRDKQLLLILDNCEHLIEASARLSNTLLHAAPELKILASSREGLGIAGETTYHVPSLPVPNLKGDISATNLETFDAVRLFVERASAAKSDFAVTDANSPAIAQICSRLDGIPLAIELAASRVKAIPVETIAARLNDRFRLLTGGSRTALPRQQTLRGTIDWSYSLLSEPERVLLRRLSVFAGGWTIEAAEAVCAGDGIEQDDVLDLLTHLVDKSLVALDEQTMEPRYRMLETVRQYALEKQVDSGEAEQVRGRHQAFYLALAEEGGPKLFGPEQVQWFNQLELENDNFRAALERSSERTDHASAMQLVAALEYFWHTRGHYGEGLGWMQRVLAKRAELDDDPVVSWARARVLVGLGGLTWNLHAKTDLRHAAEEALAIGIRLKDDGIIADAYRNLGRLAFRGKDYAGAQSYFEQSLAVYRAARSEERTGYPLMFMGDIALFEGRWQDAETRYTQTIAIWREVGNKSNLAYPLRRLGSLATQRGDFNRAERLLNESIALNLEVGERQGLAASIAASAALWSARGDENIAVQLLGAVHALLAALHIQLEAADQVEFEHNLAMVRGRLAEASFESAWAEGCSLSLEQAAKMTQQLISVPLAKMETPAPAALPDNSSLTARELDVLRLLAEGLGNQQIADRLVVSAFTVRAHLRAIYGKLGVTTRSAATRYALEHPLV